MWSMVGPFGRGPRRDPARKVSLRKQTWYQPPIPSGIESTQPLSRHAKLMQSVKGLRTALAGLPFVIFVAVQVVTGHGGGRIFSACALVVLVPLVVLDVLDHFRPRPKRRKSRERDTPA